MESLVYILNSQSALKSNNLQLASSDPVANALPSGKNWTALISESWPINVCTHFLLLISHTFAVESQAPVTNIFGDGPNDKLELL